MIEFINRKLSPRILNFLIWGEASLSDIARETKTTKANTFNTLKRLESADIVRKDIRGKTHIYRFNLLYPNSNLFLEIMEEEKRSIYIKKLNYIPKIINLFLENLLKENYLGCIFFGSSLIGRYKDIDLFIVLKKIKNTKEIDAKLKLINKDISPVFGSLEELKRGIGNKDMLYVNIVNGISFKLDILNIRHRDAFLRKEDIKERLILGYREVLSCLEFKDKEYIKVHFEKGIMDFIYAILNYYDMFPRNDKEAIILFEKKLNEKIPKKIKDAVDLINRYSIILEV